MCHYIGGNTTSYTLQLMAAHHYMLAAKKVPKLFLTYERIARYQKTVCLYVNAPSHPFPCDMCLIFVCLTVYVRIY